MVNSTREMPSGEHKATDGRVWERKSDHRGRLDAGTVRLACERYEIEMGRQRTRRRMLSVGRHDLDLM